VLDLQPVYGAEDGTYADFAAGSVSIALFDKNEMSQALGTTGKAIHADSQDGVCLVFGVENVDTTCRRLFDHGVRLLVGPTNHPEWGIRTAHFRDPAGNLIEINQPLSQP
jgi:lactoylglutathione lyase